MNRGLGQAIPEGRRLSLDLLYGQGVSSFGRVARLNPQTIDLRVWRRARRPSWALPIAWRVPTLSCGSCRCLEGCVESVTLLLRVFYGFCGVDPLVPPRSCGENPPPWCTPDLWLSGLCGSHLLPAWVRRGGFASRLGSVGETRSGSGFGLLWCWELRWPRV